MERLSKNFIWMAAANVVSGLFSVVIFIYLARVLKPEAFGYLSYAFTLIFFLANFIDLGLSTYGIREIAKDKDRAADYVSEIVSLRLLVALVLIFLCLFMVFFTERVTLLKAVVLESLFLLFAFSLATEWAFQGLEKMQMVLISFTATSTIQFALIFSLIKTPEDLWKVPVIYFSSGLPIIFIFLKRFRFRFKLAVEDLRRVSAYLSSSLVIWSISIFTQIYNSFDILLLGMFRNIDEVGCFTIARRVMGGIALFMVFLANAALPRLSHTFCSDTGQFRMATRKFLMVSISIATLVLLPVIFLSRYLILITVGPAYVAAAMPLKIMAAGLILVVFNMPYSTGLVACGLEKEVLKQSAASAGLSVGLNFMLIPKYGMIGASISFLFAEALALAWILYIYRKRIGGEIDGGKKRI